MMRSRPRTSPRFEEIIEKDDRQGDDESAGNDPVSSRGKPMDKGVFEQVKAKTQKDDGKKADQAPESPGEPAANDERFSRTYACAAPKCLCAHGLVLARSWLRPSGFLDPEEFEAGEVRRSIILFHEPAARAAQFAPVDFPARFDQHFAVAGRIGAMPMFP